MKLLNGHPYALAMKDLKFKATCFDLTWFQSGTAKIARLNPTGSKCYNFGVVIVNFKPNIC